MPDLELRDNDEPTREVLRQKTEEWNRLYGCLKERLGDWDLSRQVFDPTKDTEAIHVSLADDIADIYRDLKNVLLIKNTPPTHWITGDYLRLYVSERLIKYA